MVCPHRRRARITLLRDCLRPDRVNRRIVESNLQLRQAQHVLPLRRWLLFRQDVAHILVEHVLHERGIRRHFLDAPQFCKDWLAAQPGEVRQPVIMCRSPKVDKDGKPIYRKGLPVMAWMEFDEKTGKPKQESKPA